ncbi:unnamed protein product [Adineta ricciae]|uniref:Major facilitator superfamily (MFS) profile domain-containing protein n=1 Tax=Adineta ricciae TaxID=249248 RepID=A0A815ZBS7_ADIRI|nr:unnamed protein product [Adineta ricciae]
MGVLILLIEMNLLGGTIFGFPALFPILSQMKIYQNSSQIKHFQNALTIGIAAFDSPAFFIGILIDKFGCRFVKLISIIFHIIGWLSLALLKPGRDWLMYLHCIFSSISGIMILLTSYTSANYFSKSRALVSSLLAGAGISATMWFAVFQILIDRNTCELSTLAYVWLGFALLIFFTSFLFLDWNYSFWNLPYKFDIQLESTADRNHEINFWKTLRDPLYISVVLFLSVLIIPTVFLSVVWQPLIQFITNQNKSSSRSYTFAYNISTLSAIVICPVNGYLLGFKADRSQKQKLLNISIVETISWLLNVILCLITMFPSTPNIVIPILVLNCFCRSTVVAGCQSVISTFFPSQYIGRLTGIMWSFVGGFTFIQLLLIKLVDEINQSWKAWLIILIMALLMSSHLIQVWIKYFKFQTPQINNSYLTNTRF